jgi:hypothetical protein
LVSLGWLNECVEKNALRPIKKYREKIEPNVDAHHLVDFDSAVKLIGIPLVFICSIIFGS